MSAPGGVGVHASHLVGFYRHDEDLVRSVTGYLREGAQRGEVLLVIATPDHVDACIADPVIAAADLVTLDASRCLDSFMVDGAPDPVKFDATVGQALRRAGDRGPVRAYGEMVVLLWRAGNVTAALQLEELWNTLLLEMTATLLCPYPADAIGENEVDSFGELCRLHSEVMPDADSVANAVARTFPGTPSSPREARRFLSDTLKLWQVRSLIEDGSLIVTELTTNALLHAASGFRVLLTWRAGVLRIAVHDRSAVAPKQREPRADEAGGRGLLLVDALSATWGVESGPDGKIVWAELVDDEMSR